MLRVVNRDAAGGSMECGGRAERRRRFGRSGATRLANRKPHAPSKAASALRSLRLTALCRRTPIIPSLGNNMTAAASEIEAVGCGSVRDGRMERRLCPQDVPPVGGDGGTSPKRDRAASTTSN